MTRPITPKDRLTLTDEQIQIMRDDQTVFSLAVLMMEVQTGTLIKNKNMVANAFMKAGVILRNNPGFPERFKRAQQAIIAEMKKQGPPAADATPLPTDTALELDESKAPTMSVIDGSTPPPDQL
jgi:hypothetical protein